MARTINRAKRPPVVSYYDTEVHTWFERDRASVELRDKRNDESLVEWWDDDVQQAVEDGFLDPRDWHGSAYAAAVGAGLIRDPDARAAGSRRRNSAHTTYRHGNLVPYVTRYKAGGRYLYHVRFHPDRAAAQAESEKVGREAGWKFVDVYKMPFEAWKAYTTAGSSIAEAYATAKAQSPEATGRIARDYNGRRRNSEPTGNEVPRYIDLLDEGHTPESAIAKMAAAGYDTGDLPPSDVYAARVYEYPAGHKKAYAARAHGSPPRQVIGWGSTADEARAAARAHLRGSKRRKRNPVVRPRYAPAIVVRVTMANGRSYTTEFRGSPTDARKHFLGARFDVGHPDGPEKLVRVTKVEYLGQASGFARAQNPRGKRRK